MKAMASAEPTPLLKAAPSTSPQSQSSGSQAPNACTLRVPPSADRMSLEMPRVFLSVLYQVPTKGEGSTAPPPASPLAGVNWSSALVMFMAVISSRPYYHPVLINESHLGARSGRSAGGDQVRDSHGEPEFLARQAFRHLPARHPLKLAEHLRQQHLTPVDHHPAVPARTGDQGRRRGAVNQVDHHPLLAQCFDIERGRAVVPPDGRGVDD